MKSLLINKRFRTTLSSLVILVLGVSAWWNTYYLPRKVTSQELMAAHEESLHRLQRLRTKINALKKENLANRDKKDDLERLADLMVGSGTVQEINTEAQKLLRSFWEKHNITLDTYREVPSTKWRDNVVVRLDYQFKCELEELSELLSYFEKLEKVIRIEKLNVHYLKRKSANLQVILSLGILSIMKDEI